MQLGNISKTECVEAQFKQQPSTATKATPLELSTHMTIEQAFQAIASNCLAQVQANEAGVVQNRDAESVHQMRDGLRRLRCALELFRSRLQAPEDMLQELDWLAMELAAARDWDVLTASSLPAVADAAPHENGIAELMLAALTRAREMHEVVAAAVGSSRYNLLILHFTDWVKDCNWRNTMAAQDRKRLTAPLMKFAHNMLEHQQRRLLRRGSKLPGASPQERHKVRIAAKKIRYATEFFQSLYPPKQVHAYVAALSSLQDALGWINDAAVACRLLKQLNNEHNGQNGQIHLEASTGFVRSCLATLSKNDDKKIRELWKRFVLMTLPCMQTGLCRKSDADTSRYKVERHGKQSSNDNSVRDHAAASAVSRQPRPDTTCGPDTLARQ